MDMFAGNKAKYAKNGQCVKCGCAIKLNAKICAACRAAKSIENQRKAEARRIATLNRPCVKCGKPIGNLDKRQRFCSLACYKHRRIKVNCQKCGKVIEKTEGALKRHPIAMCSLKCQREFALVENHSGGRRIDWHSRSMKAKSLWIANKSAERQKKNVWLKICRVPISDRKQEPWVNRCSSAASCLRSRESHRKAKEVFNWSKDWDTAIRIQVARIRARNSRQRLSGWEKRCVSVAHNMRMRFIA